MAHHRNQRGRAYGPPHSSTPLLSSISQPPDLAWARDVRRESCPNGGRSFQVTGHSPRCWSGRGWKGFQLPLGASGNAADRLAGRSLGGKQVG